MDMDKEEQVSHRAYQIWEEEGRPVGKHVEHWRRARAEIYGDYAGGPVESPGRPNDPSEIVEHVAKALDPEPGRVPRGHRQDEIA